MFGLKWDWFSSLITLLLIPVGHYLVRKVRPFIKQNADVVVDAVFWIGNRFIAESLASRMSLRRYCKTQLERETTKYLPVPGSRGIVLRTDEVFIPLHLEAAERTTVASVNDIWKSSVKRIRIVGDPGSGKSSLVKQIFRMACRSVLADLKNPLPIVIDLKDFEPPSDLDSDEGIGDWSLRALRESVEAVDGFEMGKLFETSMNGRGLLILLDGLDEVASDVYSRVARAINALSRRLERHSGGNRIILTMRTQFHHQVKWTFASTFPPTFYIQPFNPADIYSFLSRWPFPPSVDRSAAVNRLFADLTDRPTLRDMCSNPLVLAMYVANDQSGDQTSAPDTRTKFYRHVTEELLVERRSRQVGIAAKTAILQQREAILGRLALENLLDSERTPNQVSFKRARRLVKEICRLDSIDDAALTLREICRDTGILTEERPNETLRFIHLTFCEYLAAKEAVEGRPRGVEKLIAAHASLVNSRAAHQRTRLVEVIPFAVGLMPRVRRPEILTKICKLMDPSIAGRCFLEAQAYDHPAWPDYLTRESSRLIRTHPEEWNEEWLRRLHLLSVVVRDEAEWASLHNQAPSFPLNNLFDSIIKGDRGRLESVFGAYATLDAQAAFRLAEACGVDLAQERPDLVVAHLSDPPFYSAILEKMQKDDEESHDGWAQLLAEGGLSSALVATRLAQEEHNKIPGAKPGRAVPRRARWHMSVSRKYSSTDGGLLRLSLLTYALAIGIQKIDPYQYVMYPRLSLMRLLRPPASAIFSYFMRFGRVSKVAFVGVLVFSVSGLAAIYFEDPLVSVTVSFISLLIGLEVAQWPKMSARYFTAMLLQSDAIIRRRRTRRLWLGPVMPGALLAALTMGNRTLAAERIVSLRHLRLTPGQGWQGLEPDLSTAELKTASRSVEGEIYRV